MGALVAIGVNEDPATSNLILGAVIFHLVVLVTFKLGAFLVLGMIEKERSVSRLSTLGGLARREPLLALPMFIFLLCLAGVPPLSGFLSKFLLITGMVDMGADFGTSWADLHWIWWMALAIFINSALSVFYYLRVAVVMFFDEPEEGAQAPFQMHSPLAWRSGPARSAPSPSVSWAIRSSVSARKRQSGSSGLENNSSVPPASCRRNRRKVTWVAAVRRRSTPRNSLV